MMDRFEKIQKLKEFLSYETIPKPPNRPMVTFKFENDSGLFRSSLDDQLYSEEQIAEMNAPYEEYRQKINNSWPTHIHLGSNYEIDLLAYDKANRWQN